MELTVFAVTQFAVATLGKIRASQSQPLMWTLDLFRYSKGSSFTLLKDHALHFSIKCRPSLKGVCDGLEGAENGESEAEIRVFVPDTSVQYDGLMPRV